MTLETSFKASEVKASERLTPSERGIGAGRGSVRRVFSADFPLLFSSFCESVLREERISVMLAECERGKQANRKRGICLNIE